MASSALPSLVVTVESVWPRNAQAMSGSSSQSWVPPLDKSDLDKKSNGSGGIDVFRWKDGKVSWEKTPSQSVSYHAFRNKKACKEATVFPSRDLALFCAVDFDASRKNVNDRVGSWPHVGFREIQEPGHLRYYGLTTASFEWCHLPEGCDPSWKELFFESYHGRHEPDEEPQPTISGLCGSVALIFALAALSCKKEQQGQLLPNCFQVINGRRCWQPHNRDNRWEDKRGVIVKVYATEEDEDWVERLEKGHCGPLFVVR